jgi:hypothetical protein
VDPEDVFDVLPVGPRPDRRLVARVEVAVHLAQAFVSEHQRRLEHALLDRVVVRDRVADARHRAEDRQERRLADGREPLLRLGGLATRLDVEHHDDQIVDLRP